MIRRLTIACGLLTLAVAMALALQGHSIFGARTVHRGATSVTAIPDKTSFRPPAKPTPPLRGLPPTRQPRPLHQAAHPQAAHPRVAASRPAGAAPAHQTVGSVVVGIARTLLNLPKLISDQIQVNQGR